MACADSSVTTFCLCASDDGGTELVASQHASLRSTASAQVSCDSHVCLSVVAGLPLRAGRENPVLPVGTKLFPEGNIAELASQEEVAALEMAQLAIPLSVFSFCSHIYVVAKDSLSAIALTSVCLSAQITPVNADPL
jgi:hypothetical protein